jgi:DNA-directed RNA polymerase subunit E'/Rpb7
MFITYKIQEDIYIPPEQYTHNINRSIKDIIFQKYLYKITKYGICVRIKSIEILDNVILRKEADLLVKLQLEMVVVKLDENEYFEGEVVELSETEGVTVAFMGILEGRILPESLHSGSLFNGSWILPFSSDKAFTWKIGDMIRFKISKVGTNIAI